MTIIVEDGTGIANANSYVTRAELIAYAVARGIVIADAPASDVFLINAMDYLESLRLRYVGTRTYDDQILSWPRTGVTIDGIDLDENEIPAQLKNAEMQLAIYASQGVVLMPTVTSAFVKREKVGPIETEYSETINTSSQPFLPLIDAMLEQLLSDGGGLAITTFRV